MVHMRSQGLYSHSFAHSLTHFISRLQPLLQSHTLTSILACPAHPGASGLCSSSCTKSRQGRTARGKGSRDRQQSLSQASSNNGWKQMQRPTVRHKAELRESCGRVGRRIEGAGGLKDNTRSTGTTNLAHGGSQRLRHQPKVSTLKIPSDPSFSRPEFGDVWYI